MRQGWLEDVRQTVAPNVWLPRSTEVHNPRLALLYRALQLLILVVAAKLFRDGRTYIRVEEPIGSVTQWLESDDAAYEAQVQRDLQEDFCANPGKYEYKYGKVWRYDNYSCIDVRPTERFRKDASNLMYIPLSFVETEEKLRPVPVGAAGPEACESLAERCRSGWRRRVATGGPGMQMACECTDDAYYLIVGQREFTLNIEHYYEIADPNSRQHSGASCRSGGWNCEDPDDKELMTVIVLETDHGPKRLGEPFLSPSPIKFPIADALDLSGFGLDGFNTDTLKNSLHCNSSKALRLSERASHRPDVAE